MTFVPTRYLFAPGLHIPLSLTEDALEEHFEIYNLLLNGQIDSRDCIADALQERRLSMAAAFRRCGAKGRMPPRDMVREVAQQAVGADQAGPLIGDVAVVDGFHDVL